jgi:hypothetical protein
MHTLETLSEFANNPFGLCQQSLTVVLATIIHETYRVSSSMNTSRWSCCLTTAMVQKWVARLVVWSVIMRCVPIVGTKWHNVDLRPDPVTFGRYKRSRGNIVWLPWSDQHVAVFLTARYCAADSAGVHGRSSETVRRRDQPTTFGLAVVCRAVQSRRFCAAGGQIPVRAFKASRRLAV